jgi:hypothetical protein
VKLVAIAQTGAPSVEMAPPFEFSLRTGASSGCGGAQLSIIAVAQSSKAAPETTKMVWRGARRAARIDIGKSIG